MADYDEKITRELLNQPKVKKQVKNMSPEFLKWFKETLVSQGVYSQYVREREEKHGRGRV